MQKFFLGINCHLFNYGTLGLFKQLLMQSSRIFFKLIRYRYVKYRETTRGKTRYSTSFFFFNFRSLSALSLRCHKSNYLKTQIKCINVTECRRFHVLSVLNQKEIGIAEVKSLNFQKFHQKKKIHCNFSFLGTKFKCTTDQS